MRIVNLTQHPATPDQIEAGVFDLEGMDLDNLKAALTFRWLPRRDELSYRVETLCGLAERADAEAAMIGGATYLMPPLADALRNRGIAPLASFTARVSVEAQLDDGSVAKSSVFKHLGFVEM